MPRAPKHNQPSPDLALVHTPVPVAEAARRCGWRRANTFRERFLATEAEALAMGLSYDEHGRAVVDARAVEAAVAQVERERASRDPDWRVKNLGRHARPRPTKRPPKRARRRRRRAREGARS